MPFLSQVGLETDSESQKTYRKLLSKLSNAGEALDNSHAAINIVIRDAEDYVKTWTNYQALWDLQPDQVYSRLSDNMTVWMNVLDEIKSMRKHFDVAETQKDFGPLVIVFGKVQSKVTLKYDNWHKEILSKYGSLLGQQMQEFFTSVSKARGELEQRSLDSGSTSDAVNFITYTQSLKRKVKGWEKQVDVSKALILSYN